MKTAFIFDTNFILQNSKLMSPEMAIDRLKETNKDKRTST